eukprot:COSAG06_NODE_3968_length_4710_cov_2.617870_4_plen_75_part_00
MPKRPRADRAFGRGAVEHKAACHDKDFQGFNSAFFLDLFEYDPEDTPDLPRVLSAAQLSQVYPSSDNYKTQSRL